MFRKLLKFWDHEESLTVFLWVLIIFVFVLGPASQYDSRLKILMDVFSGIVLVTGVWSTLDSPRVALLGTVLAILGLSGTTVKFMLHGHPVAIAGSDMSDIPALALLLYIVMKQTLKDGPITAHRVKGAVAAYLLIGVLWAKCYSIVSHLSHNSFVGVTEVDSFATLLYFSFVTLTTLGYGDIYPVHHAARALANLEALVGQLFPAVIIARVVTLEIEHRRHR